MKFLLIGLRRGVSSALTRAGHTCVYLPIDNLTIDTQQKRIYNYGEEVHYEDFDAIIMLSFPSKRINRYIYDMLRLAGVKVIGDPRERARAAGKVLCAIALSAAGVPTIRTIYSDNDIPQRIAQTLGDNIVVKPAASSEGRGVSLQPSTAQVPAGKLAQPYIECGASDERWLVVNGEVVCAMRRTATKEGEFRANLAQGGMGEPLVPDDAGTDLCKRAWNCFRDLVYAGIDIIRDKGGNPYIVEINTIPGERIIRITGHNYYDDIAKYIIDYTTKHIKP